MKISVYGSAAGDITEEIKEIARDVGREIARRNHTLITGGCPGLPYEAILGAKEEDGKTLGFSPALNLQDHIDRFKFPSQGFDELIFIPEDYDYKDLKKTCLKYRNISSVTNSDAVVIISGRCGTLNEFTIAYDLGKNIGVLTNTGGVTKFISDLVNDFNKPTDSKIIYEEQPKLLIAKLEEIKCT